jgi:hypothetical protein
VSRARSVPIHLGLDVHKDSISVAILHPDGEALDVERIFHDETSVRRLIARFAEPSRLAEGGGLEQLLCAENSSIP